MKISQCCGHWALVTGASSGIGLEIATELARAGIHLVLVARRRDRLQALADALRHRHGVQTMAIPADLASPGAAAEIKAQLELAGARARLLFNCAGAGRWGRFENASLDEIERMATLNVTAVASMCRAFLDHLGSFPSSAIVNVSSPAALQPVPYLAQYAANKAFVHSFGQALHGEWMARGVLVQTLVPGPTDTEFDQNAGAYASALGPRAPASHVARACLRGLERGSPIVDCAGGLFKQRLFAALFPASFVIAKVGKMFAPPSHSPRP